MLDFNLEQHYHAPLPISSSSERGGEVQRGANLGFMLFNASTLLVVSRILNDPVARTDKAMAPLLQVLTTVVRNLALAASRNHLVLAEALFLHPRPAEHCCLLDNVYEVSAYVPSSQTRADTNGHSDSDREGAAALPTQLLAALSRRGEASDTEEEEFREDLHASFTTEAVTSSATHSSPENPVAGRRRRRREDREPRVRSSRWTAEEDAVLKRLYALYAGTSSVFTAIAQSEDLAAAGTQGRTVQQVSTRVRQLQLHLDASEREEEGVVLPRMGEEEGLTDSEPPREAATQWALDAIPDKAVSQLDRLDVNDLSDGSDADADAGGRSKRVHPPHIDGEEGIPPRSRKAPRRGLAKRPLRERRDDSDDDGDDLFEREGENRLGLRVARSRMVESDNEE
jgi:hypothetical protein